MKEKIDFSLIKSLLRKQAIERTYGYKRGNFDIVGFILRLLIIAAFMAVFIIFFGKFAGIYTQVKTDRVVNVPLRAYELLTIVYTFIILFMTIGAVSQINREIFAADDIKLFSAMPVGAKSLYISKLIIIYISQVLFAAVTLLTVNFTLAACITPGWTYYVFTVAACLLLPLITIAIGSLFALPFYLLKQFLKEHFVINFILITLLAGLLFFVYSRVLLAVKELLLGDSLKYLFNDSLMTKIGKVVSYLGPAKWTAGLMLGKDVLYSGIGIASVLIICTAVSLVIIRFIMQSALQSRIAGATNYIKKHGKISSRQTELGALLKKEFLLIFRTPSYVFSYFSVALIMPLMVFFCLDVASPLVDSLVGLNNCNLELGIFLTLLFGALTNVFCATNISRDGNMFYSVKAMPLSCKTVFMSKVLLCMAVTVLSQLASAITLAATSYIGWLDAIFLFAVGTLFSFVYICVATRYDFNHARFSTEEDGEIKESGNVVSTIIVLGLLLSVLVGGAIFFIKIFMMLKNVNLGYLTYVIAGGAALICAALAFVYFIHGLEKKYYSFEGGDI